MNGNLNDERPIFIQISEMLENAILSGAYAEEEQVPSITELAVAYKINPATALKGINVLVDAGLLYKKRGMGMFVAQGARETISRQHKDRFFRDYVRPMLKEAGHLSIGRNEMTELIERGYNDDGN